MVDRLLTVLTLTMALGGSGIRAAQAPIYRLLYSAPNPSSQGAAPVTVLEAAPGLLYFLSTAQSSTAGGPTYGPSIFSLTGAGSPKLICSFPFNTDTGALVQAADAGLFGPLFNISTKDGRYYSVSPSGQDLQQYPTGAWSSFLALAAAPLGLYDAVGALDSHGVLSSIGFARIDEKGKVTIIHQSSPSNGVPIFRLIPAGDGNIYGVGAQSTELTPPIFIFRLTPSGAYSRLLTFPSTVSAGAYGASLVAASDGNLYGTFSVGGANKTGIVFQVTLSGQWQTVASFPAVGHDVGMVYPNSVMEASDGALYGSTVHNAIFRYDLTTHALTLAYQMNPSNLQGSCAPCNFIQGSDGRLYGTAAIGGPGGGAVFSLDFGLPKPTPFITRMVPASGTAGQKILLWGGHLVGATAVSFNGVPAAAFRVNSTQAVVATVPAGATTGPVTITTAGGSYTTAQEFTIQ
jgi:uncharacterized repeat protein (TIGR03803 family)